MSDESDNREGWTGMGIWWMSSAALIAAVLIGLVIVLVLPGNDTDTTGNPSPSTDPATPPSSAAASSSTTPAGTGWESAGCNPNAGSAEIPMSAPEASWDPIGGSSVPVSETYGPTKVSEPLRQCYQHSPTGALFAAATITTSIGANPAAAETIISAEVAPGAARDEMLAGSPDTFAQTVSAFRIGACAPERCNVGLVFRVNGGQLAETTLTLVWISGDWKLDAAASSAQGVRPVTQLPAGFVAWGQG